MAKKNINIICNKCKNNYIPDHQNLIKHLFNYKNPEESKSYYSICKKCLASSINNWFDYENIMKAFEEINVPYIEKLWHESISLTNARLLQANNNISIALSSSYEDIDEKTLLIITLFDEYFKKASQKANQKFFFNKSIVDSIQYMDSERTAAEKIINDSIKELELQKKQKEKEKIALLDEDLKSKLLDDFGYFKVDMLSDNDYIYLSRKWGLRYSNYELIKLEEYWIKTYQSFEIITSTHQDLLLKIAKISLEIDNAIEKNEWDKVDQLSKLLEKLMTSANFTPKSKVAISNRNFISSISELVAYIEDQDGFIPKFDYKVPKDLIDATISNLNNYTKNLVRGEINLENAIETALTKMEIDKNKEDSDESDVDGDENEEVERIIYDENDENNYYTNEDLDSFLKALKEKGDD